MYLKVVIDEAKLKRCMGNVKEGDKKHSRRVGFVVLEDGEPELSSAAEDAEFAKLVKECAMVKFDVIEEE